MTYKNKRYGAKNTPNKNNRHGNNRRPHWIYPGDLCWFVETEFAYSADVAKNGTWSYTEDIIRSLYPDEPLVYVRRTRLKDGTEAHYIESLGIEYLFKGSINAFHKRGPAQRPEAWD